MPSQLTYPGVYVEEIPSGVRTIVGVATSITAFVGRCRKGLTNDPILCNSFGDFERYFGGLHENYPLSYAVRDFFINGGHQALVVRLVNPNLTDDGLEKATAAAKKVLDAVEEAADLGSAKTAAEAAVNTTGSDAEKTASKKVFDAVNPAADLDEAKKKAKAAMPPGKASLSLKVDETSSLNIEATSPGTWGNELRARVDYEGTEMVGDRFHPLTKDDLFNLTVRDTDSGATERFLNLTCKDSPRNVKRVLENDSALVRVKGEVPVQRPEFTDKGLKKDDKKDPPFSLPAVDDKRSVGVEDANKSSDGGFLGHEDYTAGDNFQTLKLGLYALAKADLFNLLCLPPDQRNQSLPKEIYQDALPYCVERRAMLIVDPPSDWKSANEITSSNNQKLTELGLSGTATRNAAIYFPRVVQSDPKQDGQFDTFATCGIVAGIMARTDVTRGVWKAPAGLDAGVLGIHKLAVNLNDSENGMLNPLGINCLRTFPVSGTVLWGARTLRGADQLADEYKYIPIRRLALYLEESLFRGLQWVVFEPNDEPLWAQIRLNVGAFMHDLFRQGAFQGTTPREAYFVKCDRETTTQFDRDRGIVNIMVGFAPLKPAEFVVIKLQQMAGQIQT